MEEDYNGAGGWQVTGGEGVDEGKEATVFLRMGWGCCTGIGWVGVTKGVFHVFISSLFNFFF